MGELFSIVHRAQAASQMHVTLPLWLDGADAGSLVMVASPRSGYGRNWPIDDRQLLDPGPEKRTSALLVERRPALVGRCSLLSQQETRK